MPKCADPVLCYIDSKGSKKYRHYSLANPLFIRMAQRVFNCGKCIFCRKRNSTDLATRCVLHASLYEYNSFLTLTYDEKLPDYENVLVYKHIQDFKKRYRQFIWRNYRDTIDIFNVHEFGSNGKKHWHLVVFNHEFEDKEFKFANDGNPLYTSEKLSELWPFGLHSIGTVTEASAMYQAQYTQKDIAHGNTMNAKKSKSNHSGIGKPYFLQHYRQILSLGYIPFGGRKVPISRYFLKIAHRHYSHFYETINFFDTPERKRLYMPFAEGEAIRELADLFKDFKVRREEIIRNLTDEWEEYLERNLTDWRQSDKPDFLVSAENAIYDLHKGKPMNGF